MYVYILYETEGERDLEALTPFLPLPYPACCVPSLYPPASLLPQKAVYLLSTMRMLQLSITLHVAYDYKIDKNIAYYEKNAHTHYRYVCMQFEMHLGAARLNLSPTIQEKASEGGESCVLYVCRHRKGRVRGRRGGDED